MWVLVVLLKWIGTVDYGVVTHGVTPTFPDCSGLKDTKKEGKSMG